MSETYPGPQTIIAAGQSRAHGAAVISEGADFSEPSICPINHQQYFFFVHMSPRGQFVQDLILLPLTIFKKVPSGDPSQFALRTAKSDLKSGSDRVRTEDGSSLGTHRTYEWFRTRRLSWKLRCRISSAAFSAQFREAAHLAGFSDAAHLTGTLRDPRTCSR